MSKACCCNCKTYSSLKEKSGAVIIAKRNLVNKNEFHSSKNTTNTSSKKIINFHDKLFKHASLWNTQPLA